MVLEPSIILNHTYFSTDNLKNKKKLKELIKWKYLHCKAETFLEFNPPARPRNHLIPNLQLGCEGKGRFLEKKKSKFS